MDFPRRALAVLLVILSVAQSKAANPIHAGVARTDITPTEPIRLNGYGGRNKPSEGVAQDLWAKALAIGEDQPVVIITADLIGVPDWITTEVAKRISKEIRFDPSRLAICATHTHTGPTIKGVLENIFMSDIPADQMKVITDYSNALVGQLAKIALEALRNRKPAVIEWGQGKVDFAINRRTLKNGVWSGFGEVPDGPVDHSLPLMRIAIDGKTRALLVNYACHCTTLGGNFNQIHGDWAGRAAELIEQNHPGASALIAIGCGADANPKARGKFESIEPHAQSLAAEVERLLKTQLKPISQTPNTDLHRIELPFDPMPSKGVWQKRADENSRLSYYAKKMVKRIESGTKIREPLSYPIQTWTFGDDLAMVFLPGEVVVDYSLRLKKIFDSKRIWINAYANDIPCYIASRRLYDEGGYEVDKSMWYYDQGRRLSKDTEELVLDEVTRQLPHEFYSPGTLRQMPAPVSKEAAAETIKVRPGMKVELVAAEPLTMDPIDVAWGPDGRMWVVEMADYPNGIDDMGASGGRVRFLEDDNGDGIYDRSTLFLDKLNFPSSVAPWRDGVLITAAPDILFARDTNGDGRADSVEKLFSGFGEGNQQHRVNGLQWGLDNWIHCANGDSNGKIKSHKTGKVVDINGMDFRIKPDTGEIETEFGRTQHGKSRDDVGNWFGCNNSWPGWHFALEDRFLKRNPHVRYPSPKVYLQTPPSAGPVYPVSRTLNRLNDYSKANRFTSACGFVIYRDDFLGTNFQGNSFVCEPVHNLVRREILTPKGATFSSRQPDDEKGKEFFASTDNWSRPTSVRTGPDGALYVVDMYRFLIEHPQWVPADWQRKLKLRDGHDKGRIYRVYPDGKRPRPFTRLDKMNTRQLVKSLETPNGWQRDMAHQLLLWQKHAESSKALATLLKESTNALARMHALSILDGQNALARSHLESGVEDDDWRVRRITARLTSRFPGFLNDERNVFRLARTRNLQIAIQGAYALRESGIDDLDWLGSIAFAGATDDFIAAAFLSSMTSSWDPTYLVPLPRHGGNLLFAGFLGTAIGEGNIKALRQAANLCTPYKDDNYNHMKIFFEELKRRNTSMKKLGLDTDPGVSKTFREALFKALKVAEDPSQSDERRSNAIRILGMANPPFDVSAQLTALLTPRNSDRMHTEVLTALTHARGRVLPDALFSRWNGLSPSTRRAGISHLVRRSDWSTRLIEEARDNPAVRRSISPPQQIQLKNHRSQTLREAARTLFGLTSTSARSDLIAQFQPALNLRGSAENGRALFALACSVCHKIGDIGNAVGPDLTALTDRSKPAMLAAIIDPNRAVEDKYLSYTIATSTGAEIAGLLAEESSTAVRLVDATGSSHSIARDQIKTMNSSGMSLMPEGLESAFNHRQMADLLAYLEGIGTPQYISAESDGSIRLMVSNGSASRPEIRGDGAFTGITTNDKVSWQVEQMPAGGYDIMAFSAVDRTYWGKPFHLQVGTRTADGTFESTGGLHRFRSRKFGNIRLDAPQSKTTITLRHSATNVQIAIKEIVLIPNE